MNHLNVSLHFVHQSSHFHSFSGLFSTSVLAIFSLSRSVSLNWDNHSTEPQNKCCLLQFPHYPSYYFLLLLFHLIQNSYLRVQRCSQAKHQRRVGLWQSYSAQLFVISQNKMWLRVIYCNSSSSGQTSRFNPKWSHKYDVLKPTVEQIKRWMWTHDVLTSSTPLPC